MKKNINTFGIAALFVLLVGQLHLLRNLTQLYYILYLLSFVVAIFLVLKKWKELNNLDKKTIFLILLIFLYPIFSIVPGLFASKYVTFEEIFTGATRAIFSLPMVLVILTTSSDYKSIKKLIFISAIFTLLAAVSVQYQFIFGAISWFVEGSSRAGLERFGSLFGSLTSLGGVVGYGLLGAFVSIGSSLGVALVISGIVLGGILSLQKAAIANLILAILYLPYIQKVNKVKLLTSIPIISVIFVIFSSFFWHEIFAFINSIKLTAESENISDGYSFEEDIWVRIIDLPLVAIDFQGAWNLLWGVGPIGASGAFGYQDIPMSHNGVVDLFLVGGILYFFIFIYFIFFVIKNSIANAPYIDDKRFIKFGAFCLFITLVNVVFSGLNFFSPSGSMFFALSVRCLLQRKYPA
jgi:hypothetical protein